MSSSAIFFSDATYLPEAIGVAQADQAVPPLPWDELIQAHSRRVVLALLARRIPLEQAKELTDDAWVRVIQQHRAGRLGELRFPGIVIAQALFFARDAHRRTARQVDWTTLVSGEAEEFASTQDLSAQLLARDELRRVGSIIEGASPTVRRVFELSYADPPHSPAEIAIQLGISVQRVRQIACEFRKRLREELRGGRGRTS